MKRFLLALALATSFVHPAFAQNAAPTVPASAEQIRLSYAPVVKKVAPAIVNIYTKRTVGGANGGGANGGGGFANPFAGDPFFAPFFQQFSPMRKRVEQSLGSGFIIAADGLVVTNAHVVRDADEIMVVLNDGREFSAKSVLTDRPSDVALLRIEKAPPGLPTVTLSASETLEVGDLVLAIGNPFGVGQTVTSGIVSALARSHTDINDFDFFIQTDAAINPGNSGGPLVAMDGSVVGVNSAIYSQSGGSLGIGFAVPSEMVQAVITAEKSGQVGKRGVVRPWMGFNAQSITPDIAASLGIDRPVGALVAEVTPDGPADKAGMQRGDVITAIGAHPIRDAEELRFRIATIAIGQDTTITVRRGEAEKSLDFTATPPAEIPPREAVTVTGDNPLAGAVAVNVSPAVIEDMGLQNQTDGVAVQSITPGSVAERLGLEAGDGIIAVGQAKVTDTAKLKTLLAKPAPRGWALTIRREGRDQTLLLR